MENDDLGVIERLQQRRAELSRENLQLRNRIATLESLNGVLRDRFDRLKVKYDRIAGPSPSKGGGDTLP